MATIQTVINIGVVASEPVFSGYTNNFDSETVGSLPAGWASWDNLSWGFAVVSDCSATSPPTISPPYAFATNGSRFVRAWYNTSMGPDVAVSAMVKSSSAITGEGCGVLARGAALGGTTPVCYAATCTRSGNLSLFLFNGSTTGTILASGSLNQTVGTLFKLNLVCLGDNLRVSILIKTGADAGKYLKPDNTLTATGAPEVFALNVTDSTITGGGYCGVFKNDNYAADAFFDDFSIQSTAGDSTPPTAALTAPADGASWSGDVTMTATASDASGISKVEFLIDGVVRRTAISSPYTANLDSGSISNGSHTVAARATDTNGNISTSAAANVTVSNSNTVVRPTITEALPNLKLANLAYNPLTADPSAFTALAQKTGVVVVDPPYSADLRTANPDCHQLLYSNASNVYLSLLMNLLNYLDANGKARKDSFYHAASPYNVTGSSPSTVAVKLFWQNFRGPSGGPYTNQGGSNPAAHATAWPSTASHSLYLGYPERFRQITTTGQTAPSGGWTAVFEYCNAVDGDGLPTSWATITPLTDGTSGLTASGTIDFDPPSDWTPCKVASQPSSFGGDYRYFYVRWRVTAGGTAPTSTDATSRDFLGCGYGSGGSFTCTVPVFDTTADAEGKGWLTASQYATRAAGKDAYFEHESRLPTTYGPWRLQPYITTDYAAWAVAYNTAKVSGTDYNGIFMDNGSTVPDIPAGSSIESTSGFVDDYGAMVQGIWNALPDHATMGGRWVLQNVYANSQSPPVTKLIAYAPAYMVEFALRPTSHSWFQVALIGDGVGVKQATTSPPPIGFFDSYSDGTPAGRESAVNKYNALVYYYTVGTADTRFGLWGGENPEDDWANKDTPVFNIDIGAPLDVFFSTDSVFATGADPANGSLTYKVYQRNYTNALVLFKPLSYASYTAGTLGAGATTHALGGTFYPVDENGDVGAGVSSVTLANGQGVILMRTP